MYDTCPKCGMPTESLEEFDGEMCTCDLDIRRGPYEFGPGYEQGL